MKSRTSLLLAIFVMAIAPFASAVIINIPDDYPTIQEGINASSDGDTVLVQPGTYVENVNFNGHNTVLGSLFLTTGHTSYIPTTIVDGDSSWGSVITFENGEDRSAVIIGFTIKNGVAPEGGGIFCNYNSNPTIANNIISNNRAVFVNHQYGGGGGGVCCISSNPTIVNNIIRGNRADLCGGGIGCRYSNPIISNNCIYENYTTDGPGGGAICCIYSDPIITNSIVWDNATGIYFYSCSPVVTYCDIQGGWDGEGNIDIDPLFRDPQNGDFHLMADSCGDVYNSPCIDAGDPAIFDSMFGCDWGLGEIRSDMGAYGGGDSVLVDIHDDKEPETPIRFGLSQNYPNPFNSKTLIRYNLPEASEVTISIYDILGRKVETLVQGEQPAGYYQVVWDGKNQSSGMYFYRIQAGEYAETRKMVLIK